MPQNCLNNSSVCCFILGRDKQTGGNTPVAATADRTAVGQTDGTLKTSRCSVRLTLQEMFWIFFSFLKLAPDIIFDSLITGLLALPKNQLKRLPFRLYSRSKMHLKFESFFSLSYRRSLLPSFPLNLITARIGVNSRVSRGSDNQNVLLRWKEVASASTALWADAWIQGRAADACFLGSFRPHCETSFSLKEKREASEKGTVVEQRRLLCQYVQYFSPFFPRLGQGLLLRRGVNVLSPLEPLGAVINQKSATLVKCVKERRPLIIAGKLMRVQRVPVSRKKLICIRAAK